jgi:hypothetical protein
MSHFAPLLAAGPDFFIIVKIVVLFLIVAAPAIGKMLQKFQQNKGPAAALPRPQPRPEPRLQQPIQANAADEINDFLKRAAKARKAEQVEPIRRVQPQLRPVAEKPLQAEVVPDAPVGGKIGKQVERDLDTQKFTDRSTKLGSEVTQAVGQIDEHLHEVFDHHVSKIELLPGEAAAPPAVAVPLELTEQSLLDIPATFATGLTDLLADPDSVRQAIVLNEILHRPEERWL